MLALGRVLTHCRDPFALSRSCLPFPRETYQRQRASRPDWVDDYTDDCVNSRPIGQWVVQMV